jgi:hypothetical protein
MTKEEDPSFHGINHRNLAVTFQYHGRAATTCTPVPLVCSIVRANLLLLLLLIIIIIIIIIIILLLLLLLEKRMAKVKVSSSKKLSIVVICLVSNYV